MADKGGLQLLPDTRRKIEVRTPGENRMLIFGFIAMAVVAGLYFGLTMYIEGLNQEISDVDGQIIALEERRNKKAEAELSTLFKQVQIISGILDSHAFFSRAFEKLELLVSPKIELETAQITSGEKRITLEISAASYGDVARQISSFLSEGGVKDLEVGQLSPDNSGRISTTLTIFLKGEEFFSKK